MEVVFRFNTYANHEHFIVFSFISIVLGGIVTFWLNFSTFNFRSFQNVYLLFTYYTLITNILRQKIRFTKIQNHPLNVKFWIRDKRIATTTHIWFTPFFVNLCRNSGPRFITAIIKYSLHTLSTNIRLDHKFLFHFHCETDWRKWNPALGSTLMGAMKFSFS